MSTYPEICMCVCTNTHMYVSVCVCTHTYTYIYIYLFFFACEKKTNFQKFVCWFVVIFSLVWCNRFVKSYISKCSQFCVEYDKK